MNEKSTTSETTSKPARRMTREDFELRVVNIETVYGIAYESAKTMDIVGSSARDIAKQRRMNMMVETMICQLEEETNISVDVDREERAKGIPCPPRIRHNQTMLNWDNNR